MKIGNKSNNNDTKAIYEKKQGQQDLILFLPFFSLWNYSYIKNKVSFKQIILK